MKTHMLVTTFTLSALAAGCGKSAPAPQPPTNDTADQAGGGGGDGAPAGIDDGALWTCQIEDYDPQPCKFHKEPDGWHLSKLMGSQRFTGTVSFSAGSIALAGEFFCPWGDCTAPVDTTLTPDDTGAYLGDVDGAPVKLWWDEGLAGEWGGAGYGGRTGRETD